MAGDEAPILPALLDTLAAACAEAGDFPAAVDSQTRAHALAPEGEKADYAGRLGSYREHRPHRAGDG